MSNPALIEGIRQGLVALNSPSRVAGVVFWSVVLWLVNALSFYVGFAAFGIDVPDRDNYRHLYGD